MQKLATVIIVCFFSVSLNAQDLKKALPPAKVMESITEDYSSPSREMWKEDVLVTSKIENGKFTSTGNGKYGPGLRFRNPYQGIWCHYSDMEFELIAEGQGKQDFIHIQLKYPNDTYTEGVEFNYNAKGEWKITDKNGSPVYQEGKLKSVGKSNTILIQHRSDTLSYYFNSEFVAAYITPHKNPKIFWKDIYIYQKEPKGMIALDRVSLKAYYDNLSDSDFDAEISAASKTYKEKQKAEELAAQKAREEAAKLLLVKDSMARAVLNLYNANDNTLFAKLNALNEYLRKSMIFNSRGEIDRSQWSSISFELKNNYCKNASEEISKVKVNFGSLSFLKGKNELYDRYITYLDHATNFVKSSNAWADYIRTMGGDYKEMDEMMASLETNIKAMKKDDDSINSFIALYKLRNGL